MGICGNAASKPGASCPSGTPTLALPHKWGGEHSGEGLRRMNTTSTTGSSVAASDGKTVIRQRAGWIPVAGAVALGLAVPLLLAGRGAFAAAAVVALIGLLWAVPRSTTATAVNDGFKSPLARAVWITFSVWLVSVMASPDIVDSGRIWLRMVALLTAGLALCGILRSREDLHGIVLRLMVTGAVAGAALSLPAVLVLPETFAWLRGHGDMREVSDIAAQILKSYGTALACLMPVVLWAGWRLGGSWRAPALLFQVLAIGVLFAINSRSGLVAAGLALGVVGTWMAWRRIGVLGVGGVVLVAGGLIVAVLLDSERNNTIEVALGLPIWLVDAHRQAIWAFTLSQVGDALWLGVGINMAPSLPGAQQIVEGSTVEILPGHPHNAFLEVLVETGAIGLAAMAAALLLLLAGALRVLLHDGAAGAALLGLCAAFWFASLISYSFWSFWWQATYVLLMAPVAACLTPGLVSGGLRRPGKKDR
ncbi:MAG: hypothetical protein CMM46_02980 [Rhodospirillaceae bacterium]|nr:hypothetical protein [Rhodospirillaceae bacterium]